MNASTQTETTALAALPVQQRAIQPALYQAQQAIDNATSTL